MLYNNFTTNTSTRNYTRRRPKLRFWELLKFPWNSFTNSWPTNVLKKIKEDFAQQFFTGKFVEAKDLRDGFKLSIQRE